MDSELPLEGLFLHLVRRGFPLTFRDYQDVLRALSTGRGLLTRERLLWLLETLWTRTDEEKRQVHLLFRGFPFPGDEEIAAWTGEEETEDDAADQRTTEETGDTTESEETKVPQIQFTAPGQSGLGLPRAQVVPDGSERFVLQPRPQVSLRSLIVTWRRFRRASRTGPKTELDLAATIAEQCRRGALIHPVLVPARRNQARLVVLVDASPSMAPWRSMNRLLAESLRESRLGLGALYYFHNVPDRLFETEMLTRPVSLQAAFELHGASTLLVVSDAGAARGRRTRGRITGTKTLLEKIAGRWQPVAWANPMPPKRWPGTSAERIARLPGLSMSELSEDGLVQAIDVLRGQRSA
jgi:uncharacterized protein with von Willebrand factor type A (vWA) domain